MCLWVNLIKCKLIICKSSGNQKVELLMDKYPTNIYKHKLNTKTQNNKKYTLIAVIISPKQK